MAPAMPCKTSKTCKHGETRGKTNEIKSKFACMLDASESTRLRMWESLPNHHEDRNSRKGRQFIATFKFGSQIYSCASSHEDSRSKGSSGQGMGKLEKISAWNLTKVRSKSEVIDEAKTSGAKVHFASLMDNCHLKNAELDTKHQNTNVQLYSEVILWKMIQDLMQYLQSKDHQHHKWQPPKSWKISPVCQGAQDKQLMQYLLVRRCAKIIGNSKIRMSQTFGFVYHDTNGQNHRPVWKIQFFFLKGICTVILWQDCHEKGIFRKSFKSTVGRRFPIVKTQHLTRPISQCEPLQGILVQVKSE